MSSYETEREKKEKTFTRNIHIRQARRQSLLFSFQCRCQSVDFFLFLQLEFLDLFIRLTESDATRG